VIELMCELMGLAMQVAHSRRVLQRYGNPSSATIVFVLEELMRSQAAMCGDWGLMSPRAWLRSGSAPCSDGSQLASHSLA
jgi:predicted naringenin-chalcone synthase